VRARLLCRKAEHLALSGPFRRQVGEASDAHATREPAIDDLFPFELIDYLKDKGVRTLGRRQVCRVGIVLTWVNVPIAILLLTACG